MAVENHKLTKKKVPKPKHNEHSHSIVSKEEKLMKQKLKELEAVNIDLKHELQKYYLPRVNFIMQSKALSMNNDISV